MQTIKDDRSLAKAIVELESKRKSEAYLLKQQFNYTKERLNPVNIIKEKFSSPVFRNKAIKTILSFSGGLVSNKLISSSSLGPITKVALALLQKGVSSAVTSENPENLKKNGISLLANTLRKLKIK
ncbi:MAG TPA: hypothetical protein VF677_13450 [Flavobacterium sp.]|jgi:hypothetical protein